MADTDGWNGPRRHDEAGLGRLMNEIATLKRQVAELQRGAPLRAAGIGASPEGLTVHSSLAVEGELEATGDTTIGGTLGVGADTTISGDLDIAGNAQVTGDLGVRDGGNFRAFYPDALGAPNPAAQFGDLQSNGEYIGSGIATWEPGGDVIMAAKSDANGTTHSFGVRDNGNTEVLAVRDTTARGLSAPAFTVHCAPEDYRVWSGTDSASWITIYEGAAFVYSPKIRLVAQAISDNPDTTGDARLVLRHNEVDYVQNTVSNVGFGTAYPFYDDMLPAAIPIGEFVYVRLQGRRTSGTGMLRGVITQAVLYG